MINKLAYALNMSFEVPDTEKKVAQESINSFLNTLKLIALTKEHLDILYGPLKEAQQISTELLMKFIGKLNRFKKQAEKNFLQVKDNASAGLGKLNYFSTDTHCFEIINALEEQMRDTTTACSKLGELLDNVKSSDYKDKIIAAIDNVKKELSQLEVLIRDRVITHLRQNIVGESWMSQDKKIHTIQDNIPTVMRIYQEINNPNQQMPQIQKRPQSLNVSDSERVLYPQTLRETSKLDT